MQGPTNYPNFLNAANSQEFDDTRASTRSTLKHNDALLQKIDKIQTNLRKILDEIEEMNEKKEQKEEDFCTLF